MPGVGYVGDALSDYLLSSSAYVIALAQELKDGEVWLPESAKLSKRCVEHLVYLIGYTGPWRLAGDDIPIEDLAQLLVFSEAVQLKESGAMMCLLAYMTATLLESQIRAGTDMNALLGIRTDLTPDQRREIIEEVDACWSSYDTEPQPVAPAAAAAPAAPAAAAAAAAAAAGTL
jgi:hypothetical protein